MDKKEYIERGAMIRGIIESRENSPYTDTESDLVHRIEHNNFLSLVANQTAADVMEVVRCKDCKYHENLKDGKTWCCRCGGMAKIRADGESFCSLAERREDETN